MYFLGIERGYRLCPGPAPSVHPSVPYHIGCFHFYCRRRRDEAEVLIVMQWLVRSRSATRPKEIN